MADKDIPRPFHSQRLRDRKALVFGAGSGASSAIGWSKGNPNSKIPALMDRSGPVPGRMPVVAVLADGQRI
jgi:hypothetical protein